jgi:peptidoglycan LD-endopeptidase CwlK
MARRGSKGTHYGSLAGGFIQGLMAALKYGMQAQHWAAQEKYWDWLMGKQDAGLKQNQAAFDPAKRKWLEEHPGGGGGDGPGPNASDFEKYKHGIVGEESGGDYSIVNKRSGAVGKYQVMPTHLNGKDDWTEKYLGKKMGPEEFKNDPAAQDKLFEARTNDVYKQYGNWRDVASIWHSGVPYAQAVAEHRSDGNETTERYTGRVLDRAGLPMQFAKAPGDTATTADRERDRGAPTVAAGAKADPYALIPDVDDQGRPGQKAKFAQWNNDPIGNSDKLLASVHPDLQAVVKRAQADNPDLHFVVALGKSTAEQQNQAKDWGWSQIGAGPQAPHMQGVAVDLWPVDAQGRVHFDPAEQAKINAAMQKASQELKLNVRWGGTQSQGGANKSFSDAPNFQILNPRPLKAQPAAAKPLPAAKPAPPPVPPAQAAPSEPLGPKVAGEAEYPIQPAIPAAAGAPAPPAPPPPPVDYASASGYGPEGKWGPNPPLAERPQQPQPDQVTPASNMPPPAIPMQDSAPEMMAMDTSPDTSMDMGMDMGMAARRGGVVRRYWRGGPIRRYQGGGGIEDPGATSVGMPPGLAAGGQQQIPPIYFNPATYAAAGAPVGKGISATSAPTYTAGAIPTLPMQRGGVVQGYQEGGDVGDFGGDMPDSSYADMAITADLERRGGGGAGADAGPDTISGLDLHSPAVYAQPEAQPAVATDADTSRPPIQLASNIGGFTGVGSLGSGGPRMGMGMGMRGPTPRAGGGGREGAGGLIYTAHPDDIPDDPDHPNHPDHPANHPDLPPHTPQVMDQNGNPARDLVSFFGAGLHHIAQLMGLEPGQPRGAISSDPNIQANSRSIMVDHQLPGGPRVTNEDVQNIRKTIDPNNKLNDNLGTIAGYEAVLNAMIERGDTPKNIAQAAAAIQLNIVQTVQNYGKEARAAFARGDLQGGVDALAAANDACADGTIVGGRVVKDPSSPEGWAVQVSGHKLNGDELWNQVIGPRQILSAVTGAENGSLAWRKLEEMVGKYDPDYQEKVKARVAYNKQAAIDAGDEDTAKVLEGMQQPPEAAPSAISPTPVAPGPAAPVPAAPVTPAASTPRAEAIPTTPGPSTMVAGDTAAPVTPGVTTPPGRVTPSPVVTSADATTTPASPDSTGTAAAQPRPADADTAAGRPQIPPGPTATPTATPAVAASPVDSEETRLNNTLRANVEQIHADHRFDPKTNTFVGGPPVMQRPATIPGYANLSREGRTKVDTAYREAQTARNNWEAEQWRSMNADIAVARTDYNNQLGAVKARQLEVWREKGANVRTAAQIQSQERIEKWREEAELRKRAEDENRPMKPEEVNKIFTETSPPSQYLARSVHTVVPNDQGGINDTESSKALGQMFDMDDNKGLQRINRLGVALKNAQTYNPHLGTEQLSNIVVGMANDSTKFRVSKSMVNVDGMPMHRVQLFRDPADKEPTMEIVMSRNDVAEITAIKEKFSAKQAAQKAAEARTSQTERESQQYPLPAIPPMGQPTPQLPLQGFGMP